MAKKKSRDQQTSAGERPSVNKKILNLVRKDKTFLVKTLAQQNAFKSGKKVVLTVPNPNPNETNKRFIRIDAKDVWRNEAYIIKQG
jgi:DNA polymerase III delta subunit